MNKKNDLTSHSIFKALIFLALPLMGTSFVQMAYNLTDVIWIGKIGSDATAAVGTAGFFMWLSFGFILICRVGAEVLVAQNVGRKDYESLKDIVQNVLQLIVMIAIVMGIVFFVFNEQLIAFFNIKNPYVVLMAESYLKIISIGLIFYYINPVFTGIFNGYGKTGVPFAINTIGLIVNIILDPLLIFGIGPFPQLGVIGAGLATIIAQGVVTIVFVVYINVQKDIKVFQGVDLLKKPNWKQMKEITDVGLPVGVQSILFTVIAMYIARIIAQWGYVAVAVQKVGSQIESISWMTASGFSTAISTFVGQNYGAKKYQRIIKGYEASLLLMVVFGIFTSAMLLIFPGPIFKIFINEAEALKEGIVYLKILGISQLFMCVEIMTNGAFTGLGKTKYPAINSTVFNFMRIPMAILLSHTALSLSGVWWSITISSVLKGTVIVSLFILYLRNIKKELQLDKIK
jgi:putative MATE family efflux protein